MAGANGTIIDSKFINNIANVGSGGALNWIGNNGIILSSDFINNTSSYRGGAIYWPGVECKIEDSTFIGNTGAQGGAIHFSNNKSFINLPNNKYQFTENKMKKFFKVKIF